MSGYPPIWVNYMSKNREKNYKSTHDISLPNTQNEWSYVGLKVKYCPHGCGCVTSKALRERTFLSEFLIKIPKKWVKKVEKRLKKARCIKMFYY